MHDKVENYDANTIEKTWKQKWYDNNIYQAEPEQNKPKFYCLDTWAYPSAEGVHIGYVKSFGSMDVIARYKRMRGFNVLYPGGWDTLGLPAENYAIKTGGHPREITNTSIHNFKEQYQSFGLSYDWSREINTADPSYYRWTQWLFLMMYKKGLAYRQKSKVNWCPKDKTVVAKEQIVEGNCERCGTKVEEKELMQWFFKITDYADRLFEDCEKLDWEEKYRNIHKKWIGKEVRESGKIQFHIHDWCVSRQRYWGPPIPIVYCDVCGTVPVPEPQLPVILPHDVDFTPTGESPLAKDADFVNTTCPTCGKAAKRETDTLDTLVSSSWYQFRFIDPFNTDEIASKDDLKYWQNVDHYQGTIEHLTAHLIYARFVTKVLFDQGYVPVDEPFPKYTPVGLLVDKKGDKFSKRLGNAPDTNALVEKYGGDLLRLSCYFISSFDDITRWGEEDVVAVERLRNRIWRIFKAKVDSSSQPVPEELIKNLHQTIKYVEENIEDMKFNVAISKIMVLTSEFQNYEGNIDKTIWEAFTKMLAPFAPFMAEEMWSQMGHSETVHKEPWPTFDPKYISDDSIDIAIEVNGRVRGTVSVPRGSKQLFVEQKVKENPEISKYIQGYGRIVFIEDKVINFI